MKHRTKRATLVACIIAVVASACGPSAQELARAAAHRELDEAAAQTEAQRRAEEETRRRSEEERRRTEAELAERRLRSQLVEEVKASFGREADRIPKALLAKSFGERGEFETAQEYRQRFKDIDPKKVYYVDVALDSIYVDYNVDTQTLTVEALRPVTSISLTGVSDLGYDSRNDSVSRFPWRRSARAGSTSEQPPWECPPAC